MPFGRGTREIKFVLYQNDKAEELFVTDIALTLIHTVDECRVAGVNLRV